MILQNRFFHILIAIALSSNAAIAQAPEELQELVLTGDLHGRADLDFRKNAKNIQFVIPEGSEGTVLESRKLSRTGSYGIKIRITKVNTDTPSQNSPKVGDETWVYFAQKDPWLTFKDKDGAEVQDPELALTAQAAQASVGLHASGIEETPHLPTKEEILREQKSPSSTNIFGSDTEGETCTDCFSSISPLSKKNFWILDRTREGLEAGSNSGPEVWDVFPAVRQYSLSPEVQKSIKYAQRNRERRSKKLCYRYVKRAILGGDLVDDYLPGAKARYGVADLKRRGFINMMEDLRYKYLIKKPEDAPKGAILIYRNTKDRQHAGHIEIKTDWGSKGGYVSDFYRSTNTSLYNRELIGVMIKEKL